VSKGICSGTLCTVTASGLEQGEPGAGQRAKYYLLHNENLFLSSDEGRVTPTRLGSVERDNLNTVDSRLSARGLTALRLNRGNVFLKKKFYFP
jgi:hypothetical protein